MKEIETKLLGLSYKDVERALKNSKPDEFYLSFCGKLTDTYYKRDGEMVRFRLWEQDIFGESQLDVTIKGLKEKTKYPGIKIVEELELHDIANDSSIAVLELMGFKKFSSLTKRRMSYVFRDVKIECDEVAGKKWVEIEGPTEEAVIDVVIALGYRSTDCCDTPTWKLLQKA